MINIHNKVLLFILIAIVLLMVGVRIYKFKRYKKEHYSLSKSRIILTVGLYITFLHFIYAPLIDVGILILMLTMIPFVIRVRGVYSYKSEIVLSYIEIPIRVMTLLSLMFFSYFIVIWALLILVYGVLAILLDMSRKGKCKLGLFGIILILLILILLSFKSIFLG